jgi:hypothetical protein
MCNRWPNDWIPWPFGPLSEKPALPGLPWKWLYL